MEFIFFSLKFPFQISTISRYERWNNKAAAAWEHSRREGEAACFALSVPPLGSFEANRGEYHQPSRLEKRLSRSVQNRHIDFFL